MTNTVKLRNSGKSNICYGLHENAIFKPDTCVDFPVEIAEKLKRLYPNQVVDLQVVSQAFVTDEAAIADEKPAVEEEVKKPGRKAKEKVDLGVVNKTPEEEAFEAELAAEEAAKESSKTE